MEINWKTETKLSFELEVGKQGVGASVEADDNNPGEFEWNVWLHGKDRYCSVNDYAPSLDLAKAAVEAWLTAHEHLLVDNSTQGVPLE